MQPGKKVVGRKAASSPAIYHLDIIRGSVQSPTHMQIGSESLF
jgi:hypothetical protein